jgi:hypothetical protein
MSGGHVTEDDVPPSAAAREIVGLIMSAPSVIGMVVIVVLLALAVVFVRR